MTSSDFNNKFLSLSDGLYRLAFGLLESKDDAEDAVQDLYLKLWNMRGSLNDVENPKSYCLTLMHNLCIDRIRRATACSCDPSSGEDIVSDLPSPDAAMIHCEQLDKVEQAIAQLPERQRMVIEMRVYEELSYEEITKKTGINNLNLRVLLSNARKNLKSKL